MVAHRRIMVWSTCIMWAFLHGPRCSFFHLVVRVRIYDTENDRFLFRCDSPDWRSRSAPPTIPIGRVSVSLQSTDQTAAVVASWGWPSVWPFSPAALLGSLLDPVPRNSFCFSEIKLGQQLKRRSRKSRIWSMESMRMDKMQDMRLKPTK